MIWSADVCVCFVVNTGCNDNNSTRRLQDEEDEHDETKTDSTLTINDDLCDQYFDDTDMNAFDAGIPNQISNKYH